MKTHLFTTLAILFLNSSIAQNITLEEIIDNHTLTFEIAEGDFDGEGWTSILNTVNKCDHVLIGEDHFSNEIPFFIKKITEQSRFDNFYVEVDPYSTSIIETSIKNLAEEEREIFNSNYKELFSFYALDAEYDLLESLVGNGVKLLGSDQIIMYADRLVLQDLYARTQNEQAKVLYKAIMEKSKEYLNEFFENPENPMYMLIPEFKDKINELQELDLSDHEQEVLAALLKSADIYNTRSHKKRVQLLKHQLMKDYDSWKDKRTLFKFGANHLSKGESLLRVYDIGNLIANISEANYKKATHIAILGQSGTLGSPFKKFPPTKIDITREPFVNIKPFLTAEGKIWKVFDLKSIRTAFRKNKIKSDDVTFNRVVNGYDFLVIIPEVTPAKW